MGLLEEYDKTLKALQEGKRILTDLEFYQQKEIKNPRNYQEREPGCDDD